MTDAITWWKCKSCDGVIPERFSDCCMCGASRSVVSRDDLNHFTERSFAMEPKSWKLKFRCEKVEPGQKAVCVVQSANTFRGERLVFGQPECFEVISLRVGAVNQFRLMEDTKSIPCVVLHNQEFKMDVAVAREGLSHTIVVINTSGSPSPFYAELHGAVLTNPGEDPQVTDWEDYVR